MAQRSSASCVFSIIANIGVAITTQTAHAQALIWDGPDVMFTKIGSDDELLPENQDRLTSNVWITRGAIEGPFNIAPGSLDVEDDDPDYIRFTSPDDTLWATEVMPLNAGKTIAASNFDDLAFTTWAEAYGGPGGGLLGNITTINAVVWLVSDDIYFDIQFTDFTSSGDMTYVRSSPSGDYNNDGIVDAADYVMWRKDPSVGAYSDWVQQFGEIIPPGAGGTAVPEPTVGALLALMLTLLLWMPARYIARPSWPGERKRR